MKAPNDVSGPAMPCANAKPARIKALVAQEDLLRGSSGISATFGNACLASANEFTVAQVELWSLSRT